ncbi:hypothetical protein ALC57_04751, partial [Trachymyrmex cornetzi]
LIADLCKYVANVDKDFGAVETHRNFNACILKHGVSMKLIVNEQVKCQPRNKDYEDRQRLYATDGDLFSRRKSPSSQTRLPRKSTIPPTIASTTIYSFLYNGRCRKWCVMWYIFFIVPFLGLSGDKNVATNIGMNASSFLQWRHFV